MDTQQASSNTVTNPSSTERKSAPDKQLDAAQSPAAPKEDCCCDGICCVTWKPNRSAA